MTPAPAATTVHEELLRIAEKHGGELRAEDVVKEAEPQGSVLHPHFEWSNATAAHEYRLEQARRLIRVTVEYVGDTTIKTRVFVSLRSDRAKDGGGYRVTADVMANGPQRSELLRDALLDMQRFQEKYQSLRELGAVFDAMRGVAA